MDKLQLEMQLNQFDRLISLKRVSLVNAYYVIFSDYPTEESLIAQLDTIDHGWGMPNVSKDVKQVIRKMLEDIQNKAK
jgi:hypothetical protein